MARLYTCGFEENNFDETNAPKGGFPSITTVTPHSGTYALLINVTASVQYVFRSLASSVSSGTYFTRAYIRFVSIPAANTRFLSCWSAGGGAASWAITMLTTGILRLTRVPGSADFDSAIVLSVDTWYRVEVRHLISDTAGQIEVRLFLGDAPVALQTWGSGNFPGGDGIDADSLGGTVSYVAFGTDATGSYTLNMHFDDLAINDASNTGDGQTSWPGPGNIALVVPNGNFTNQWNDQVGGTSSVANVDDLPGTPNDADYNVQATTLNQIDELTFSAPAAIPSNATLTLMDVYARVGSNQTATTSGRLKVWDHSAVLTDGPTIASFAINGWNRLKIGTGTGNEHLVIPLSVYSKANLDLFHLGYENITDTVTRPRRVSALWANVEWVPSARLPSVTDTPTTTEGVTLSGELSVRIMG